MRGEKSLAGLFRPVGEGSPPLARGKGELCHTGYAKGGITPACAGKSPQAVRLALARGDHPRLRGEKNLDDGEKGDSKGSPPLARGKVEDVSPEEIQQRITPACAGKSIAHLLLSPFEKDHPRLRGEKSAFRSPEELAQGSPPLARGKARCPTGECPDSRITPACAGKRSTEMHWSAGVWDHPRLRGEKYRLKRHSPTSRGSPPLARGKEITSAENRLPWGITPACAGKRNGERMVWKCDGDHPRLRGEKT